MLQKATEILRHHKLRKTNFRIQVLSVFLRKQTQALTSNFVESKLMDFDRITLYRTLKTFEKSGVIHKAIDGGDEPKYALCHSECSEHNHFDDHAHFLCNQCGATFCLDAIEIPTFKLPKHYKLSSIHLALTGICDKCNS